MAQGPRLPLDAAVVPGLLALVARFPERGDMEKIAGLIEQANVQIKVGQLLFLTLTLGMTGLLTGLLVNRGFVFAIGLGLAWLVKALVIRIIQLLKLGAVFARSRVTEALQKMAVRDTPAKLVGRMFYWLITFIFFILALKVQSRVPIHILHSSPPYVEPWLLFMIAYTPFITLIFNLNRLYNINVYLTVAHQIWQVTISLLYSVMGIALLSYFTKASAIVDSRLTVLYFIAGSLTLLVLSRVVIFRTVFRSLAYSILPRRMLIVGAGKTGIRLATRVATRNPLGLHLTGFLDDDLPETTEAIPGFYVLGKTDDVGRVVEEEDIDEIVVCVENEPDIPYLEMLDRCAKTRAMVLVAAQQFAVIPQRTHQEVYGDMPVFGIMNTPPYLGRPGFKQAGDMVMALLMVLFLAPVLITVTWFDVITTTGTTWALEYKDTGGATQTRTITRTRTPTARGIPKAGGSGLESDGSGIKISGRCTPQRFCISVSPMISTPSRRAPVFARGAVFRAYPLSSCEGSCSPP